jgi:3-keto-L-gulonate-6-phosphate decarboxylase
VLGERVGVDVEVALAQTLLAVAEKSVVRSGQEQWVIQRIVDFFTVSQPEVMRYREKGYTLSSIILAYGIAKAANASPERVFEMRQLRQSWSAIAVALGVKPQELSKALQGMFP